LFYMEDYEVQIISKGHCPFCRHSAEVASNEDGINDSIFNDSGTSSPNSASNEQSSWH
ncbi:putative intraflagellar transport 122 protein, partial [Danaus plexippus plexippus]